MYYRCSAGGWNKTHEQIERTPRIDSFELPLGEPWSILYCGCKELGDQPLEVDAEGNKCYIYPLGHRKGVTVRLSHKHNGFGGAQAYFLCPDCVARVRFLYLQKGHFLCRKCARLNYRSQQRTRDSMADYYKGMDYVKLHLKSPHRAIDGFSYLDYIPEKPRGMWDRTYRHHLTKFLYYQQRYAQQLIKDIARIAGKLK